MFSFFKAIDMAPTLAKTINPMPFQADNVNRRTKQHTNKSKVS
jgi:hypothetical protein